MNKIIDSSLTLQYNTNVISLPFFSFCFHIIFNIHVENFGIHTVFADHKTNNVKRKKGNIKRHDNDNLGNSTGADLLGRRCRKRAYNYHHQNYTHYNVFIIRMNDDNYNDKSIIVDHIREKKKYRGGLNWKENAQPKINK